MFLDKKQKHTTPLTPLFIIPYRTLPAQRERSIFTPRVSIFFCGITSNMAFTVLSGTSMFIPHITGLSALFLGDNQGRAPA